MILRESLDPRNSCGSPTLSQKSRWRLGECIQSCLLDFSDTRPLQMSLLWKEEINVGTMESVFGQIAAFLCNPALRILSNNVLSSDHPILLKGKVIHLAFIQAKEKVTISSKVQEWSKGMESNCRAVFCLTLASLLAFKALIKSRNYGKLVLNAMNKGNGLPRLWEPWPPKTEQWNFFSMPFESKPINSNSCLKWKPVE